jgi:hypothetical protein
VARNPWIASIAKNINFFNVRKVVILWRLRINGKGSIFSYYQTASAIQGVHSHKQVLTTEQFEKKRIPIDNNIIARHILMGLNVMDENE